MDNVKVVSIHRHIKSVETEVSVESLLHNNMSQSHAHNKYELYFLMSGSRRLLIKNNFYKMEKGDLVLISPEILHKTLDDSPPEYKRMVINFPSEIIENVMDKELYKAFKEKDAIIVRSRDVTDYALDAVSSLETADENCPKDFEFLFMSVLYRLIHFLISEENILPDTKVDEKKSGLVSDVLEYINRNYTDSITISELSMHFFVSEFHLCRSFKKSTGRTIIEYVMYLRIEKAKKMLTKSQKQIREIAKLCGFNSIAHFNHVFKEFEKVNPSQFRRFIK